MVWTNITLLTPWVQSDGFAPASWAEDAYGRIWLRGVITGGTDADPICDFDHALMPTKTAWLPTTMLDVDGNFTPAAIIPDPTENQLFVSAQVETTDLLVSLDSVSWTLDA